MKHAFLKTILTAFIALFAVVSFAEQTGTVQAMSIDDAVKAKTALKSNGVGSDTDILAINYTDNLVHVNFPGLRFDTKKNAAFYQLRNYTGQTLVTLQDDQNRTFWSNYVGYQDIVEIYWVNNAFYVIDVKR
jgi:hypothetical protein